ncbi:MAG: NAD-dependent dihydropyrimidine dehydrogenase subunit PreA [Elusimicrobia bacterium]|nr:NAD-dependent dihydropyrimidine dehydrogenase subunit PreA [Elusimicrobiota bacterium]
MKNNHKPRAKIDLSANTGGIKSPNPFWLASAPPTNSGAQIMRAFEYGWGGAVWKTLGQDPPVVNVTSRYGAMDFGGQKIAGFNNIELITDRPLAVNLKEIYEVKKRFPKNAVIASLMVPCERQAWHDITKKVIDAGSDGIELNFGCPHGMSERGMGAAVGQVPEYVKMVTEFVKEASSIPVLVKLTPNVADVRFPARAAKAGGADGVSLINTINSIMGVDVETMVPKFSVGGKISHGGYCGPAVKPIALNMISQIATDPETRGLPISGIGGISNWSDAVEFMLLGSSSVQLCTAVMHHGFRIVEDLNAGLSGWMRRKGFTKLDDFIGKTAPNIVDWKHLNLHHKTVASIDKNKCIGCDVCYVACNDTTHQCIAIDTKKKNRKPHVVQDDCVGCNLCSLVCPVDGCITMTPVETGLKPLTWEELTKNGMKGYGEVYRRH